MSVQTEEDELIREMRIPDYYLRSDVESVVDISKAPTCPVVVFINPRSGGQLGVHLLTTYRTLLNHLQIFDLDDEAPDQVLYKLLGHLERLKAGGDGFAAEIRENMRIIVAGGDGTAGWLLGVVSDLKLSNPPPIATVPLGTGNNLPFSFGWAGGEPYVMCFVEFTDAKCALTAISALKECLWNIWHPSSMHDKLDSMLLSC